MIKKSIFFLSLLFCGVAFAQTTVNVRWQPVDERTAGDSIFYSSARKLVWKDFKGRPDAASPAAAITESGFGYKLTMNSLNNRTSINITVFCYFNKRKSWVKAGMNTNYALLHEQHHFDITYINTVAFIQKLKEAHFSQHNYQLVVDRIHDECFNALEKMQNDYDGETSNGRIKPVQEFWNKKIDNLLTSLATD